MPQLSIIVEEYVDDHQPGFVRFSFVDLAGVSHSFVEKVPVITAECFSRTTSYPRPVDLECTILERHGDAITVDLSEPLGVENSTGKSIFTVASKLVTL